MSHKSFITIFLFILIGFLLFSASVFALEYQLEQPLPGGEETVHGITEYVKTFYLFGLGLVGVAALFALVFGGIIYMTAGTITKTEEAIKWIWGALGGLLLMLGSYLILNTINPDLVNLKEPEVPFPTLTAGKECSPPCDVCQECSGTGQCVNAPDGSDIGCGGICMDGKCQDWTPEGQGCSSDKNCPDECQNCNPDTKKCQKNPNDGTKCNTNKFCFQGNCLECLPENQPCGDYKTSEGKCVVGNTPCCSGYSCQLTTGLIQYCTCQKP